MHADDYVVLTYFYHARNSPDEGPLIETSKRVLSTLGGCSTTFDESYRYSKAFR